MTSGVPERLGQPDVHGHQRARPVGIVSAGPRSRSTITTGADVAGTQTYLGLPVVGFMVRTFNNGTLTCGTALPARATMAACSVTTTPTTSPRRRNTVAMWGWGPDGRSPFSWYTAGRLRSARFFSVAFAPDVASVVGGREYFPIWLKPLHLKLLALRIIEVVHANPVPIGLRAGHQEPRLRRCR